ncbi:phage tail tube protein [Thalassococcus sp. S3]|uniref:phage tail tube protein n=1 Tax=Thalassococcus sp. S3 TaxID=2017482 RepID=UPI001024765A|nr:phage tail tube protein [Thalassococcus sp. S3]QBF32145.1 outer capsid protein Hoc [Thalassococcus sp. S3]
MTDAQIGYGSKFKRGTESVGEVTSIGPPSLSRDTIDATHMESPGKWREFIAGLKDGGEVSCDIQSKPSTAAYQAMVADFDNDDPVAYAIEFPDGSKWSFSAFITGMETSDPLEDKIETSATFKITGQPVFTVPAP